jgi:hypothetical protein
MPFSGRCNKVAQRDRPASVAVHALITAPEMRDPAMLAKLDTVAGRVLKT